MRPLRQPGKRPASRFGTVSPGPSSPVLGLLMSAGYSASRFHANISRASGRSSWWRAGSGPEEVAMSALITATAPRARPPPGIRMKMLDTSQFTLRVAAGLLAASLLVSGCGRNTGEAPKTNATGNGTETRAEKPSTAGAAEDPAVRAEGLVERWTGDLDGMIERRK